MSDQPTDYDLDNAGQQPKQKSRKGAKNQYSPGGKIRSRGSNMPKSLENGPITSFAKEYTQMLKALPKVKTAHKPKYDTMFVRKFMILVYLVAIEREQGFFSVLSIREHFRVGNNDYPDRYFTQLVNEGWINAVDTHMAKHRRAVLSPLFYSLISSITAHLRREHPERFKAQALAQVSNEVKAITADQSPFDIVVDVPDMR